MSSVCFWGGFGGEAAGTVESQLQVTEMAAPVEGDRRLTSHKTHSKTNGLLSDRYVLLRVLGSVSLEIKDLLICNYKKCN